MELRGHLCHVRRVLLCLAFVSCALATVLNDATAQAVAQRIVSGIVVDARGEPIERAAVVLRPNLHSGRVVASDVTDDLGEFKISTTRSGELLLVVSHVAYGTRRLPVPAGGPIRIELSDEVLRHPEVAVIESRGIDRISPITTTNIDRTALERLPTTVDLPAQLAYSPSVTQYSENGNGLGYTYLRLRGFDQRRIAVSINGIPQNDPETFDVFWINFFDIQDSISDIQIQRGASGSFYGSTGIGGGINIVAMPYSPEPRLEASGGYGSFDTRRFAVDANSGLINNRFIVRGRLGRVLSSGYREWSWSEYWRYFVGIRRVTKRSVLTLQSYGGPHRDGLAYVGIPKEANDATVADGFGNEIDRRFNVSQFTRDVERFRQPHVELHHDWAPSADVDISQRVFWVRGVGHFDFDGSFRSADYLRLPPGIVADTLRGQPLFVARPDIPVLFRAALDQWQAGWQPSLRFRRGSDLLKLGAEFRVHRSVRWGRIQESASLPDDLTGADAARAYDFKGEKVIGSLFASYLYRPSQAVAVQADASVTNRGYRVYDEAYFGTSFTKRYLFVNPRLGVTLFPEQPLSAFASVALARREPRLKALYDGEEAGSGMLPQFRRSAGGGFDYDAPFVTPESVLNVEVGARARLSRWESALTAYVMSFSDEIVPSGGLDQFGIPRTGNAAETRHVGVEAEGRVRILPGVSLWANGTLSSNTFLSFVEYGVAGDEGSGVSRDGNAIAGFPSALANVGTRVTTRALSLDLSVRVRGKQYVDNSNGRSPDGVEDDNLIVDPFFVADASVRYRFRAGRVGSVTASLDLFNVTNQKVLLSGNSGFGTPQFFPGATRNVFFALSYQLD